MEGVINRVNPYIRFREISLQDRSGVKRKSFHSDEDIVISISFECMQTISNLLVIMEVVDENNTPILTSLSVDSLEISENLNRLDKGTYNVMCILPRNTFGGRSFFLTVHLIYPKTEHLVANKILEFEVRFQGYNSAYNSAGNVFIRPQLKWAMRS